MIPLLQKIVNLENILMMGKISRDRTLYNSLRFRLSFTIAENIFHSFYFSLFLRGIDTCTLFVMFNSYTLMGNGLGFGCKMKDFLRYYVKLIGLKKFLGVLDEIILREL